MNPEGSGGAFNTEKVSKLQDDVVFVELDREWQTDQSFKDFMGVEFSDLDRPIAPLIYALWKRQIVKTEFSCAGHVGEFLLEAGRSSRPENLVHTESFLFFTDIDPSRTQAFVSIAQSILKDYPFAHILKSRISPNDPEKSYLLLTMRDISVPTDREKSNRLMIPKEVPKAQAEVRIKQFHLIWKKLAVAVAKMQV